VEALDEIKLAGRLNPNHPNCYLIGFDRIWRNIRAARPHRKKSFNELNQAEGG